MRPSFSTQVYDQSTLILKEEFLLNYFENGRCGNIILGSFSIISNNNAMLADSLEVFIGKNA